MRQVILSGIMEKLIAINQFINKKEEETNKVFIHEAQRVWDEGVRGRPYPQFMNLYTRLLWEEYVKQN